MPLDDQARLDRLRAQPRTDRSLASRTERFLDALQARLEPIGNGAEAMRFAGPVEGSDEHGLTVVGLTWWVPPHPPPQPARPSAVLDLHLLRLGDDPFAPERHRFGGGAVLSEGGRAEVEAMAERLGRSCPGVGWEPVGGEGIRGLRLIDRGGDPEGAFHALRQLGRAFPAAFQAAAETGAHEAKGSASAVPAGRSALGWQATWARWREEIGGR